MKPGNALKAVSQLLFADKDREEWFSLGENHEKAYRIGLHQLRNCFSGFTMTLPREVMCLLFSRHARRTVYGLVVLRRTHEYVLVMAALEGARDGHRAYYEGYVDALQILGARALSLAKAL